MNPFNKLRWRCRRGSLELDMMLGRYLESGYLTATVYEQHVFLQLLDLEDSTLTGYLLEDILPQDQTLANLILTIRYMHQQPDS